MKLYFYVIGFSLLTFSCTKDKAMKEVNSNSCVTDITTVSYTNDIQPILNISCSVSGCHNAGNGAIPEYINYTNLKNDVDNGKINDRVFVQGDMPPSYTTAPTLSQCDLDKIQAWIDNGAPNN